MIIDIIIPIGAELESIEHYSSTLTTTTNPTLLQCPRARVWLASGLSWIGDARSLEFFHDAGIRIP